jgi:hypothetical protein
MAEPFSLNLTATLSSQPASQPPYEMHAKLNREPQLHGNHVAITIQGRGDTTKCGICSRADLKGENHKVQE